MMEITIIRENIGFGFTVCGENPPTIESIAANSPADRAGLKKNDIIISINSLSVRHAPHDVVINFMRSKKAVSLVISRDVDSARSTCKFCDYPPIARVSSETHPQPTMLATLLYLGSHEIPAEDAGLESIYSTIDLLHQDSHLNTVVTMEVNSHGISIKNAAEKCIAFHNILSLRYCGMWPQDKRYFGLITYSAKRSSCHVFMTDLTYHEKFLSIFGHSGLTVTSVNGSIGHKHKMRVATHIVRGFASVYCHRNDVQVDQTKLSREQATPDTFDTESVFYDCTMPDNDRATRLNRSLSISSLNSIQYNTRSATSDLESPSNNQQTNLSNQFSAVVGEGGRIADWAKGFDKLLEDPDGILCFQEFLKKEYADENIKFWLACRNYEKVNDAKKRQEEAARIISEYLVSGSPNPVNVDSTCREEVIRNSQFAQPNLFKPMQKQIYNLMMYGKYWQFTRGEEYLTLLEQEKMGKNPVFNHSPKDGKRKNAINEHVHQNQRNRKFFSNFFSILKRSDDNINIPNNNNINSTSTTKHHNVTNSTHARHVPTKHYILLEMPNCTLRRAYYNPTETVKGCIERALVNSGVNGMCYHVCIKRTGEVLDVSRPVSQFANVTLSFLNTPTFQVLLCNDKKLKFCTAHGKTLKDICKSALFEHNIDIRSVVLFERDTRSYVRLDTESVLVANKCLEIRDITQRSTSVPRLSRKMSNKNTTRRSMVGCSGSLESNLDLLSSVMESSDDDNGDFPSTTSHQLVRSQSELEFFELLNRVQCDRLDNQRCSHPTVLKNLSLGRRGDSTKSTKDPESNESRIKQKRNTLSESRPESSRMTEGTLKRSYSSQSPRVISDDDIDYC